MLEEDAVNSCGVTKCTKYVIKDDKEDVLQDVTYILSNIVVTEFLTHMKDDQFVLGNCEETIILKSESDAKADALVIVFNIQKRMDSK